jgi:hypothetical protein
VAFNVFFNIVINDIENFTKANPWRCDCCHKDYEIMMKVSVDYDTLVLCEKCLMAAKKKVTEKKKEIKNERKSNIQPKKT